MAKKSKVAQAKKLKKHSKFSTRVYNRCENCGRQRGYMSEFKLCRICFRLKALDGEIPGVTKASW